MRYANDGNIAARKDASLPLANALLEGARAMLDGRDGNYTAIPGFKERYLAEEFVPLLRTYSRRSDTAGQRSMEEFLEPLPGRMLPRFVHGQRQLLRLH